MAGRLPSPEDDQPPVQGVIKGQRSILGHPLVVDGNAELGTLATMCKILSDAHGGGAFFLSCRTVERLFGISRMCAWRWLKSLEFFEIIAAVKTGTLKDRQATTWLYKQKVPSS